MAKIIDPGQLNEKIDIKRQYYRRDDTGSEVEKSKMLLHNVWSKVEDVTGLEDEESGRIVSVAITKFTVRYYRDLLSDWKNLIVCYGDAEYDVIAVRRIGRKSYIEMKAVLRE